MADDVELHLLREVMMSKNNFWGGKNSRTRAILEYEGGAEKLLQYADVHPSARELAQLKIKAELKRWGIELRPPTIGEIQYRYNFTEEFARNFLVKLKKARNFEEKNKKTKILKPAKQSGAPIPKSNDESINEKIAEKKSVKNLGAHLKSILLDIRTRYGEEIRQKGEQTSVKQGFVYLVKNPCFPGWIKAGMTIDYELRLGAYNISDPRSRFEYLKLAWTQDRRIMERTLLKVLELNAGETRGEWFRIQTQEAIFIFDQCWSVPK